MQSLTAATAISSIVHHRCFSVPFQFVFWCHTNVILTGPIATVNGPQWAPSRCPKKNLSRHETEMLVFCVLAMTGIYGLFETSLPENVYNEYTLIIIIANGMQCVLIVYN